MTARAASPVTPSAAMSTAVTSACTFALYVVYFGRAGPAQLLGGAVVWAGTTALALCAFVLFERLRGRAAVAAAAAAFGGIVSISTLGLGFLLAVFGRVLP